MKNIFKYLSIFAIAGSIGLQTMNVTAAESCSAGEEVHTDYFLFVNTEVADDLKVSFEQQPAGQSYMSYNGANKFNNIKGKKIIAEGDVKLGASSSNDTAWTTADFWRNWANAVKNPSSNMMYNAGTKNYIFHDKWWVYPNGNFDTEPGQELSHIDNENDRALIAYIEDHLSDLSLLVNSGTMTPDSVTVTPPPTLKTSQNDSLKWFIVRSYDTKTNHVPDGIPINGVKRVYAPSAYYVQYCAPGKAVTDKTITYEPNGNGVVNMPGNQTFQEECESLDSTKPVRTGYSFLGWAKSADSTKPDYQPGDEYCGDSITLYAVWAENQTGPFKVTYDANGGKDAPADQSGVAPNQCVLISKQKPTLADNTFLGWSTNKNSRMPDPDFDPGDEYCGQRGDLQLYAIWSADTGINAHLVAFGIVAIGAVGALLVAKKKDLFKQI